MGTESDREGIAVSVRNLGGIGTLDVDLDPGVTVLAGRNATNRTSLLRSIAAALGGSRGTLNTAADEGHVHLEVDGERYTRTFERGGGTVCVDGDPFTDDATIVDLFASLLEANPVRRAVERGDTSALRDLLLRPVDTEAIAEQIEHRRRRKRQIAARLDEIDRKESNLPALEARRQAVADDLDAVESELADCRETVAEREDAIDPRVPADGIDTGDADESSDAGVVATLRDAREEYERVHGDSETQEAAVESLEAERAEVEAELADLEVAPDDIADLEADLERRQARERELSTTIDNLLSIVAFNESLVEESGDVGAVAEAPGDPDAAGDPIEALGPDGRTVTCWTCGTPVERGAIVDRLDDLRDVVAEKREVRSEVEARIEETRATLAERRDVSERRSSLRERLDDIDDELAERRSRIEALQDRESTLRERIDALEADATGAGAVDETGLLADYRRLSELEHERGQLDDEIRELDEEIASIEALADERADLEAEREAATDDLAELRGRIERLEVEAVETFNEEMETVLGLLEYENVERVWIERKPTVDDAPDPQSRFELHVVREDDAVFEDTVDTLSESEREVIGLVVALAGALVHDVQEVVPVLLLDSLEAIDADRIATLVTHVADVTPYVVVALLPEDAHALPDAYDRVSMGSDRVQ